MRAILVVLLLTAVCPAFAAEGLMSRISPHDIDQTYRQLTDAIRTAGMKIMLEVDHSENAKAVGAELRPTRLVVFGNAAIGSALMNCGQSIAIDLPQRMLVWQDDNGKVRVGYNAPKYLFARHGIEDCKAERDKVTAALERLVGAAVR